MREVRRLHYKCGPSTYVYEVIDKGKISETDNRLVPIVRFFMLPGYVLALFPPDDVSCLEWLLVSYHLFKDDEIIHISSSFINVLMPSTCGVDA